MDHNHCENCIKVNKCSLSRRTYGCAIIFCKLDCLAQFHACKEAEHFLLCKNEKVSCINVEYGCKKKMKRFECGHHLSVCPASVVVCSKEWNRWSIKSGTDGNMEEYTYVRNPRAEDPANDHQLDTSLALYDQQLMKQFCTPGIGRITFGIQMFEASLVNNVESKAGCDSATEYFEQLVCVNHNSLEHKTDSKDEVNKSSKDLIPSNSSSVSQWNCGIGNVPDPTEEFLKLSLDTAIDSVVNQRQPLELITFRCGQGFRRDRYISHYKNIHDEIHAGINGWFQERCPLSCYGCNYSRHRFYPDIKGQKVIFSPQQECIAIRTIYPYMHDINTGGTTGIMLTLTDFPVEVLEHITRFLDAFSLCNLARTSTKFRDVCCSIVQERGMVLQEWKRSKKKDLVTWKPSHKRWLFGNGFSPVKRWGFEDSEHMSEHLKKCPFNDRNVKDSPFLCGFLGLARDLSLEAKLLPRVVNENDVGLSKRVVNQVSVPDLKHPEEEPKEDTSKKVIGPKDSIHVCD